MKKWNLTPEQQEFIYGTLCCIAALALIWVSGFFV